MELNIVMRGGEIRPTPVSNGVLGDAIIDFVAGQLAALTGLAPCAILIWQVVGVDKVFGGDAKASEHLFNGERIESPFSPAA